MAQMIFVPMTRDEARALRAGTATGRYTGCAATPGLAASLEANTVLEEVEYAALSNAGVLALVLKSHVPRLVVAAEVPEEHVRDLSQPNGEVEVSGLVWAQVRALVRGRVRLSAGGELGERGGGRGEPGDGTGST